MTDHYAKARSLLAAAAGFAARTADLDPSTLEYATWRDSVASSTAAGHAYATLALVDAVRALAAGEEVIYVETDPDLFTNPAGARGGEQDTEGASPA